jgi:hypothetical protein
LTEHPVAVAKLRQKLPELQLIALDELSLPQWVHLAFYFSREELCAALKPALLQKLQPEGNVIFLAAESIVYSPLSELCAQLDSAEVLVTPYLTQPLADDGHHPTTLELLASGPFQLGFIGVRGGPAGAALRPLLAAWQQAMEGRAAVGLEIGGGAYADQLWAAGLCGLTAGVQVVRSTRYNLGYWNVGQSGLHWDGVDVPRTSDGPLGFYNFTGLDPGNVSRLSRHQDRVSAAPGSPLFLLLSQYVNRLAAAPLRDLAALPYSFGRFIDGSPIGPDHRRAFGRLPAANRRLVVNPFAEVRFVGDLVAASSLNLGVSATDLRARLAESLLRVSQLEQQLHTLPHSIFGHVRSVMDQVAPGSSQRLHGLLQQTSQRIGPKVQRARQLLS